MKKYKILCGVLLITMCFIFSSCTFKFNQNKPYNFYYTNLLAKNFLTETSVKASLIDTSYYKNHDLTKEEVTEVVTFLKKLKKHNYIKKASSIPLKPMYRMFFTFSKEKYVIDVFNSKYVSIYPWDGTYEKDYLDISDIPPSCSPYNLCEYAVPR